MARRREVGIIKACVLGMALAVGLGTAAQAGDNKLTFTGSAAFTTDYMFRSISQHKHQDQRCSPNSMRPTACSMPICGDPISLLAMASRSTTGGGLRPNGGTSLSTFGGLEYTYPGANSTRLFRAEELPRLGPQRAWTLGINNYWSPDNFQVFGTSLMRSRDRCGYAFSWKLFNFFSPSISGAVGYQSYENDMLDDYTLLERRPDARLPGPLVCRHSLLRYGL